MNLGTLRTQSALFCEDPNQTRFTPAKYNTALNSANAQFAMDSKSLYKDQAIVMVKDTAAYALASDFILEKKVTLNGIELKPISRATLESMKTSDKWTDDTGTPGYFIIDPEEARKTITLYPIPNSDNDGTALVLTYYPLPATMVLDTDIPLNSSALLTQFHLGIAAYASWLLLLSVPSTPEISDKKNALSAIYNGKVAEAVQTFGNTKSEPLSFHVGDIRVR